MDISGARWKAATVYPTPHIYKNAILTSNSSEREKIKNFHYENVMGFYFVSIILYELTQYVHPNDLLMQIIVRTHL